MNEYQNSAAGTDLQSERQQVMSFKLTPRTIVKVGGLLLMLLFFAAPLTQCSQESRLNATGLEIAAGTGKLMSEADKSYPIVFVLLLMPIILVARAFANKSFLILRNVSIGGLASQIIFMIAAYAMLNSKEVEGAFVLTAYNWLIVAIYIGLCWFTNYCNKQEATEKREEKIRVSRPKISLTNKYLYIIPGGMLLVLYLWRLIYPEIGMWAGLGLSSFLVLLLMLLVVALMDIFKKKKVL